MKLRVIAVGKLRDAGLQGLCDLYVRRLAPMIPTAVTEARDAAAARALLGRGAGPRVLLDERGDQVTTRELAEAIGRWREQGVRELTLAIGGADGWDDDDRRGADRLLALSRLTLPHRLARLLLLEQLYRAATILGGHPYHHDG